MNLPPHTSSRLDIVLSGGDDRTVIVPETGRNKYHLNPLDYVGLFNRGSCTNSTLNEFSAGVVARFVRSMRRGSFSDIRRGQESRLKALLNFEGEDNFECFFAPSGSDLAYLPLLFSRMLNPERKIVSLVTCPEELGAGTLIAGEGRYFMTLNQFGETLEYRSVIDGAVAAEVVRFPARDDSGAINDHHLSIRNTVASHEGAAVVGGLVIGSKSGIEDNIDVVKDVSSDVLWTVDLCQFRNSKRLIKKLLDMGCMVMVTGSKFYESPPFCAAMLLPRTLVSRLADRDGAPAKLFERVFAAEDCPAILPRIRTHLRSFENFGLLARWECALAEMEAFDSYPAEVTQDLVSEWNGVLVSETRRRESFDLIPDQERTNPTIVSFRVKRNGKYLHRSSLDVLFKQLVLERYREFAGFERVSIGQPVNYGDKSFIRIAIGSHGLRNLMDRPRHNRYDNDLRLLDVFEERVMSLSTVALGD